MDVDTNMNFDMAEDFVIPDNEMMGSLTTNEFYQINPHVNMKPGNEVNMDDLNYNLAGFQYNNESFSDKSSPSTNNSLVMTVDQLIFPADKEENLNYHVLSNKNSRASNLSNSTINRKDQEKKSKRQLLDEQDAMLIAKDDSELTEAELQLKRKAQNRAAQRAFRERKETKLKDLELKLNKSEEEKQQLIDQLEAIRRNNLNVIAENQKLKNSNPFDHSKDFAFPKNEKQFIDGMLSGTHHVFQEDFSKKAYDSPDNGNRVLALGAVWDYLLYKVETENLNVDVVEVMRKLKGNEKCHGFGPAYPVDLIDQVLEACAE